MHLRTGSWRGYGIAKNVKKYIYTNKSVNVAKMNIQYS